MSSRKKALIGLGIVICAPAAIAGAINGATQSDKPAAASTARTAAATAIAPPRTAAASTAQATTSAAAEPTFRYPGMPQCAITYRDNGDGTMSWTVTAAAPGELITHAGTKSGSIYRHDQTVPAGTTTYRAPVPLAQIDDIGGNLSTSAAAYACSVRPAA